MALNCYGIPVALLGVSELSLIYNSAAPWMLGTDEMDKYPRALIAQGRQYTRVMLARYARLENYVDVRNTRSVAWLQHIGFKFDAPRQYGVNGELFCKFWMER